MRRGSVVAVALLLAGGLAALGQGLGLTAAPALANQQCTGTENDIWIQQNWTDSPTYASGIRSPIGFRDNGIVCDPYGATFSYIGLQTSSGSLTQMGFAHVFDVQTGVGQYCKFWENFPATGHLYACGEPVNDVNNYFQIHTFISGFNAYYALEDCGIGGGYGSNCYSKDNAQPAYTSPYGVTAGEVHWVCTDSAMGSITDPERYGSNSYPLEGENQNGWLQRTWDRWTMYANPYPPPSCAASDYQGKQVAQGFQTWDNRYP